MEKQYDAAVYIGRFQPFHLGHLAVFLYGLDIAKELLILVGSSKAARTAKNPFSFEERANFIKLAHGSDPRITIAPIEDYFYGEKFWNLRVRTLIDDKFGGHREIALLGHFRDNSSYYLQSLSGLVFEPLPDNLRSNITASQIREGLFHNPNDLTQEWVDGAVDYRWGSKLSPLVEKAIKEDYIGSCNFDMFCQEYRYILDYKKQWAKAPFSPTFFTADYVLHMSGHILVVKRKLGLGKGLWALPGGFVRQGETARDASVRELREETQIGLTARELVSAIKDKRIFDYPERSLRGRTVTVAHYAEMFSEGLLPKVKGSDDAESAYWMPISECFDKRDQFFEDHFHIINHFLK